MGDQTVEVAPSEVGAKVVASVQTSPINREAEETIPHWNEFVALLQTSDNARFIQDIIPPHADSHLRTLIQQAVLPKNDKAGIYKAVLKVLLEYTEGFIVTDTFPDHVSVRAQWRENMEGKYPGLMRFIIEIK